MSAGTSTDLVRPCRAPGPPSGCGRGWSCPTRWSPRRRCASAAPTAMVDAKISRDVAATSPPLQARYPPPHHHCKHATAQNPSPRASGPRVKLRSEKRVPRSRNDFDNCRAATGFIGKSKRLDPLTPHRPSAPCITLCPSRWAWGMTMAPPCTRFSARASFSD